MKTFNRLLSAASVVLMLAIFTGTAYAQFPQCNGNEITIKNYSDLPVEVCIKYHGCHPVPANDGITVPVLNPPEDVPGIAGVANTTHTWQPAPPGSPAALWIPSVQMFPSFRCFDVYYDEPTCAILVYPTVGPPCLNP